MFYILRWSETESTAQLAQDLGRTYKTVLNFVNQLLAVSDRGSAFSLSEVSEVFERHTAGGERCDHGTSDSSMP